MKPYEIVCQGELRLQWTNDPLPVPDSVRAAIGQAWTRTRGKNEGVFDGELLVFDRLRSDGLLTGRFAPYRYFVAKLSGVNVAVRPIGVSGLLRRGDSILFGRRLKVTQYSGRMELVPSGSIDRSSARPDGTIAAEEKIFQELAEETGYARREVSRCRPIGLVLDTSGGVYDLAFELQLDTGGDPPVSVEYDMLRWSSAQEIVDSAMRDPEQWVPTSLGILDLAGLLR